MMADKSLQEKFQPTSSPAKTGCVIGITMGCPSGVGPEIILRLLAEHSRFAPCRPVVVGDIARLERTAGELGISVDVVPWNALNEAAAEGAIEVIEPAASRSPDTDVAGLSWGKPSAVSGHASAAYIKTAVQLINQGVLQAMVTCPISKAALQMAGYSFPGHTEMLASLCGTRDYGMLMAGSQLRVALVTIHTPLTEVPQRLNEDEILRIIKLTNRTLEHDYGISRPRIGVAGLNPHGGENGLFGNEEELLIGPAVARAISENLDVTGPLPPDTIFNKAVDGRFDVVVAMYHDQGLIPFKLLHFQDGVNVTMGLPIVRTSVDHGTAYDIAGKGMADPASLAAAFLMAGEIAQNRYT